MRKTKKKLLRIAVMGGGKGTSRLLAGLKKYPVKISAVISTADDGSSSGALRKEFNMVPPGDMRQCLVALADNKKLAHYFHARFAQGTFYSHPLGNIFLALLYQHHGNIQKAVDETCALLGIRGHEILPATLHPTTLVAKLSDGKKIKGEANITSSKLLQKNSARLALLPKKLIVNPRACDALKAADAVIVAPGNLFASVIPVLLPSEIQRAFLLSKAKKIFISNLMTQEGHTENFTPSDFVHIVESYLKKGCFDAAFYNTFPVPHIFWNKNIGYKPVIAGYKEMHDTRFIPGTFAKPLEQSNKNDSIAALRSLIVHDEDAIAKKIFAFLQRTTFRHS